MVNALAIRAALRLLRTIACLAFLSAGHFSVQAVAAELPQEIAATKTIRVGSDIESSYKPFEYFGSDGVTPEGFDIDLATEIGKRLGVKLDIQHIGFDNLITALKSKRVDLVVSSAGDTVQRQAEVTFIDYAVYLDGFLQRESGAPVKRFDKLCGLRIITLTGSVYNSVVDDQNKACPSRGLPEITKMLLESSSDAVLAVRSERADIFAESLSSFQGLPAGLVAYAVEDSKPSLIGMAVRKDEADFAETIKGALQQMIDDGSYMTLLKKWGLESSAITTATINGTK